MRSTTRTRSPSMASMARKAWIVETGGPVKAKAVMAAEDAIIHLALKRPVMASTCDRTMLFVGSRNADDSWWIFVKAVSILWHHPARSGFGSGFGSCCAGLAFNFGFPGSRQPRSLLSAAATSTIHRRPCMTKHPSIRPSALYCEALC